MKKLLILLFSILISFNSYGGWFDKTVCVETNDVQDRDGIIYLSNETKPFSGKNLCKYENSQNKSKGKVKDGKKNDIWTEWYENGQKMSETAYKDGKTHGKCISWHENGQIKSVKNYKDGKYDGKVNYWYEDGQIKTERIYKEGKEIGESGSIITRYLNGQIKLQNNYKDGKKDGKTTYWYENGQKLVE